MAKERGIYERPPKSKIYWIRYTDLQGHKRWEKCGTLTAARTRLSIRHAERAQGIPVFLRQTVLLGTLLDDALVYIRSENDAYAAVDLGYKFKRIRAAFGTVPIARITQSTILKWLEAESALRLWSPATRNRYQAAWSLIFRIAIQNKKASENPAHGIKRRREDNQRTRVLTDAEELTLVRIIEERFPAYAPVFLLALHTGMRASELLRARVGDLNWQAGMIAVRQRKVRSAAAMRYVPVTPLAVRAYTQLAQGKAAGAALCSKYEGQGDLKQTRPWFNPCVEQAGLDNLHWHDLRHTFATRLVMSGVPLPAVSLYLGHQSITMTMRYSHLSPGIHQAAIAALMSHYPQEVNESVTKSVTSGMKLVKMPAK